ncbi:uncharacterized protein LOC126774517 [Nymphalis io]|uniref:uncharacterized protein LOC126774517 n=1 Tax=Inachis io TaxID=171585 RepID=UPI00216800B1|nr:uncharacterized protein LOC126774517 [Nymphalis io]
MVRRANLNHCCNAQQLLMQTVAERSSDLAVIAEPYNVPDHSRWFGDVTGTVAVYWAGGEVVPPCSLLERGQGSWLSLADYEVYLDWLASCVRRCLPRPLIVLGDFNAHARTWGNPRDDPRGETLLEWAAVLDLRLVNRGSESTCVRWQGESIVDLTWSSPAAIRVLSGWRVAEVVVTLPDHRYIVLDVTLRRPERSTCRRDGNLPHRWSFKRLNRDFLEAAAIVTAWSENAEEVLSDSESESIRLRDTMTSVCDVSMPRTGRPKCRVVYWWSTHIAQLRESCLRARREYTEEEGKQLQTKKLKHTRRTSRNLGRLRSFLERAPRRTQQGSVWASIPYSVGQIAPVNAPTDGHLRSELSEKGDRSTLPSDPVKSLGLPAITGLVRRAGSYWAGA